jgi:hypothetical protein
MRYVGLMVLALVAGCLVGEAPTVRTAGADDAAPAARDARVQSVEVAAEPADAPASSEARIARALLEALRLATDTVVAELGQPGAFLGDPAIRIPLPGGLEEVRRGLVGAGLGPLVDDLERRMNRAAEQAVPEARAVFREALSATTIEDAQGILTGPDDSATRYFATRMGPLLAERMGPIVDAELREAGAVQAFDAFVAQYAALPLMPDIRGSLTGHVVEGALAGLFYYMAEEERAIRHDPAARTTALLRAVFGEG